MRLRALDGGHLGDVWQRGAGGIAWVASERQLRSVIGSGVEPKGPIWMGCVIRLWKIMGENTKIMGQIIGDLFEKIDPQRHVK